MLLFLSHGFSNECECGESHTRDYPRVISLFMHDESLLRLMLKEFIRPLFVGVHASMGIWKSELHIGIGWYLSEVVQVTLNTTMAT